MTNKEHAIKFLQSLPADEDAVVIMFTKSDVDLQLEVENKILTNEQWDQIVRRMDKIWPSAEMWDEFSSAANEIAEGN
jgi:malic enzyme